GRGGIVAYCGSNNLTDIEKRIVEGDSLAESVVDAMCYQISKEIAMLGAVFSGRVDLIVLTGGMANNRRVVRSITSRVSYLAPVDVIPGEREMISLARAAYGVLVGEAVALDY
ncbi:MAG TPA: butyrate kinase, partial [Spirochaetia bacterium]|nr:butyrate kinase [Spirochaetia bacterium]